MPFGEDIFEDEDMNAPLVLSDLFNGARSPVAHSFVEGAGPTVVTFDDREEAGIPEADMMDMFGEADVEEHSPAVSAPSSTLKKRGRPSLSASATPAKSVASRTPRSAKGAATPKSVSRSAGKPKAAEPESEQEEEEEEEDEEEEQEGEEVIETTPAPKRGRPRSTAAAAKPARKVGRPKKNATNGEVAADEYEVETIVESAIDADTMEHMYLVKWKNYPASENTWEPKKNLKGSLDLVRKFDTQKKKAEAAEAAKKAATKKTAAAASGPAKRAKVVKAVKKVPGRRPGRPPGRKTRARA